MPGILTPDLEKGFRYEDDYDQIPAHMRGAIERYIIERLKPGDFLTAVICNDLSETVARADSENRRLIPIYVRWFYNYAPGLCWGTKAKMNAWLNRDPETL